MLFKVWYLTYRGTLPCQIRAAFKWYHGPWITDDAMDDGTSSSTSIPDAIRQMLTCEPAVQALGSLIWYLRQLNIDKDILSMKNFNIYDPMKKGQGLVLDGQTLAHIEVT